MRAAAAAVATAEGEKASEALAAAVETVGAAVEVPAERVAGAKTQVQTITEAVEAGA